MKKETIYTCWSLIHASTKPVTVGSEFYTTSRKRQAEYNVDALPVCVAGLGGIGYTGAAMGDSSKMDDGLTQQMRLERLGTPVSRLHRLAVRYAEPLERLGLRRVLDFLSYFPRSYEDFTDRRTIDSLTDDDTMQSLSGRILFMEQHPLRRRGGSILTVHFADETGQAKALFFNQPWLREKFFPGQQVVFSGKPKPEKKKIKPPSEDEKPANVTWVFGSPKYQIVPEPVDPSESVEENATTVGILPVYGLTEGLPQWAMRRLFRLIIEENAYCVEDVFSPEYLASHELVPIGESLRWIHFPPDMASLDRARRRLVYYELLLLQLAIGRRRRQQETMASATPLEWTSEIDQRIRRLFPAPFTEAQDAAVAEIVQNMGSPIPMGRLLQGDVGSGKTWVAVYAMLLAAAQGRQAVLMAPTEVLARQHFRTLDRLLGMSRTRYTLLLGGMRAAERAERLREIENGEISLVVGTHAILHGVKFATPALVVIDEQHKFGVRQRAHLRNEKTSPHYLVMTATPIPRTVTMTLFGDLDVSTLRGTPPGRKKVFTYLIGEDERAKWTDFVVQKIREGRQAYWVVPLVEESFSYPGRSLEAVLAELQATLSPEIRIRALHGRMSAMEKESTMLDFRAGEIQVLVSTTVVEVGVDVPNATLMTIESGDCFGLAQLHQLRGRIVRGTHPGYCGVFAKFGDASDNAVTDSASGSSRDVAVKKRIEAFVRTTDGFELAEIDFELRGPGELLGTRQHGMPEMMLADLQRDRAILEETRHDAAAILRDDPGLASPDHSLLRRRMLAKYKKDFDLADTG